jgi:hypothetical protein
MGTHATTIGRRTGSTRPADDAHPTRRSALRVVALSAVLAVAAVTLVAPAVSAAATLPDERAVELVSTDQAGEPYRGPEAKGEAYSSPALSTSLLFRAASNGEAMAYIGEPAVTGGTGEFGPGEGNQWLGTRTPAGWTDRDIFPPRSTLPEVEEAMYQSFSSSLATSIYQGGPSPLTPAVQPGCRSLYVRDDSSAAFTPLFTAGVTPANCGHPLFAGSSSDESHVIFQSEAALTSGSEEATEVPPGHEGHHFSGDMNQRPCLFGCNLYDASAGQLHLVNIIEEGTTVKTVPNATFGGYAGPQREMTNFSNAISSDGSRIFWTDTQSGSEDFEHVYVRENDTKTIPVSGPEPAEYWAATPDGHYAFYTEAGQLWRFDTEDNTRTELTTTPEAHVLGVIAINQTGEAETHEQPGRDVYIVAEGDLTGTEQNTHHEEAHPEEPNLYLIQGTTPRFIATLSPEDNFIHSYAGGFHLGSDWRANLGERITNVTPNGQHLAFQSVRNLTGYPEGAEEPQAELYVYSAKDGQLVCASCMPNGGPRVLREGGFPRSHVPVSGDAQTYSRRWISEDGNRVFFNSYQPLVPQDTNGVQDVYEWEREGAGTCSVQAPSRPTGGCVSLLSEGSSLYDSFLVESDAAGDNVFIEHVGPLGTAQAPAGHLELFDVRVHGGFPAVSEACRAAACQTGPAPAPAPATPASTVPTGLGNFLPAPAKPATKPLTTQQKLTNALRACRRDRIRRRRVSCERAAHARYRTRAARRAGNYRRTHS